MHEPSAPLGAQHATAPATASSCDAPVTLTARAVAPGRAATGGPPAGPRGRTVDGVAVALSLAFLVVVLAAVHVVATYDTDPARPLELQ